MISIFIIAFISNSWTKNGGDWLNLTTIQDAYQNHYVELASMPVETAIREPNDLTSIIKEASDNPHSQYKLIFVSDHGAKAIRTLSDLPPNVEIIWSGHQLVAEWEQLPVHKWYLPEHSRNTISESHHLRNMIPLPGVITPGHKLSDHGTGGECTTSSYTKEVIWMLSGDARKEHAGDSALIDSWLLLKPDYSERVVQIMTENSVFNDAQKVSIVNSPRTGQWEILKDSSIFSSMQLGKTEYHTKPLNLESNIDPITQSAQKAVLTHLPNATIDIGHYWREEPNQKDDPIIHHSNYQDKIDDFLQNPEALLLIPGDSVTDVSKIISTQHCIDHRDKVFVILTDTMTPSIASWIESLYSQGYFGAIEVRSDRDPLLLTVQEASPEPKNILSEVKQSLGNSVTMPNRP